MDLLKNVFYCNDIFYFQCIKFFRMCFYPYSIKINKCKGSCNTINDPYSKLCVPDTIKHINVKVFNLMSRINETRHIE